MIRGLTVLDVFTCIRGLFRWHGTWFPDELACLQEAKGWCHHIVSWRHNCRPVKFCKHSVWKVKLWKAVKAAESSYGKPHLVSAATENLMRLKGKSKSLLESCDHGAVSGIMDNSNPGFTAAWPEGTDAFCPYLECEHSAHCLEVGCSSPVQATES